MVMPGLGVVTSCTTPHVRARQVIIRPNGTFGAGCVPQHRDRACHQYAKSG